MNSKVHFTFTFENFILFEVCFEYLLAYLVFFGREQFQIVDGAEESGGREEWWMGVWWFLEEQFVVIFGVF